jgi:hypothetical protein
MEWGFLSLLSSESGSSDLLLLFCNDFLLSWMSLGAWGKVGEGESLVVQSGFSKSIHSFWSCEVYFTVELEVFLVFPMWLNSDLKSQIKGIFSGLSVICKDLWILRVLFSRGP